jgi:hypothetical protein
MKQLFNIPSTSKWSDNAMNPPVENCLTNFSIDIKTLPERFKEEVANYTAKHDDMPDTLAHGIQALGIFNNTEK